MRDKTACFTGHRPNKLGGYNENNPTMRAVKHRLREEIEAAIANGYTRFISGMALGVDMVAAELVLEARRKHPEVQLVAAVPFEGQEKMWPDQSIRRWKSLLEQCDEVVHVCEPGYAAWKMQKRNEYMVDHSSLVIAVWDGTKGGTGNCVQYAKRASHAPRIVLINPPKVTTE